MARPGSVWSVTAVLSGDPLQAGTGEEAAEIRAALSAAGLVSDDAECDQGSAKAAGDASDIPMRLPDEVDPAGPLGTLLTMWQLGQPVEREAAGSALGLDPSRLVELGLVSEAGDGRVAAEVVIALHEGLWFACDSSLIRPGPLAPNFVMPIGGSSLSLAGCIPSDPFDAGLDVGTGCGIQAILAARHGWRVVGTDVNRRALSMARFNAWLNSATNVEFREGSFYEPVSGEQFDLLMGNPPFVVSPDTRLIYRDGPDGTDSVCRTLISQARAVLRPGGIGVMLVNWIRHEGEDPFQPPSSWVAGTGLDAAVIHHFSEDGETYARRWLQTTEQGADPSEVTRWTEQYRACDVSAIAMGLVTVHRPFTEVRAPWFASYAAPLSRANRRKGDHLRQLVALQEFLQGPAGSAGEPDALLGVVLRPAESHELNRTHVSRGGTYHPSDARARIGVGFPFSVRLDVGTAEVLGRCDGHRTLGEVLSKVTTELGVDSSEMVSQALASVRKLISMGFLLPPEVADLEAGC